MSELNSQIAAFVKARVNAVRFFRLSGKNRYESAFAGGVKDMDPNETRRLEQKLEAALEAPEVQAFPTKDRLVAAWNKVRIDTIDTFVKIAKGLCLWEDTKRKHPNYGWSEYYERFTHTGLNDISNIGESMARSFGLGDAEAGLFHTVKWTFADGYRYEMFALFQLLQQTDDRDDVIPTKITEAINRLASVVPKPGRFTDVFIEAFFSGYLFSRGSAIKDVVISPVGNLIDPTFLLMAANEQGAEAATVEAILNTYGPKVLLSQVSTFGDGSVFRNFPNRSERELSAVKEAMDSFLIRFGTYENTQGQVSEMTNFLQNALEHGLIHPNWPTMIQTVKSCIGRFPSIYQQDLAMNSQERLGIVEAEYKKATKMKSPTIKGQGFETAYNDSGATEIYLDGEMLTVVADPIFSDSPCGNNVVAWSKRKQIDASSIAGLQFQLLVQMVRKGEEVRTLYSDTYYTNETYLSVTAPTVDAEGVVHFNVNDGKQTKEYTESAMTHV